MIYILYIIYYIYIYIYECFVITIYVCLFALGLKDYSMNIQDLSNLRKFDMTTMLQTTSSAS